MFEILHTSDSVFENTKLLFSLFRIKLMQVKKVITIVHLIAAEILSRRQNYLRKSLHTLEYFQFIIK